MPTISLLDEAPHCVGVATELLGNFVSHVRRRPIGILAPYFVGQFLQVLVLLVGLFCPSCSILLKLPPAIYRRRDANLVINDGQLMDACRKF